MAKKLGIVIIIIVILIIALSLFKHFQPERRDINVLQYIGQLKLGDGKVRQEAESKLIHEGDASVIPGLSKILNEENNYKAAYILGEIGDTSAIPALVSALETNDRELRSMSGRALLNISKVIPEVAEANPVIINLIKALDESKNTSAKIEICWLLGEIGDTSAIPALAKFQQDEDKYLRSSALSALSKMGDKSLIFTLPDTINNKDENLTVRLSAVKALGKLGDISARPILIQTLSNEDELIRREAAFSLAEMKDSSSAPEIIKLLKDESETVRSGAAYSLGELKSKEAVPFLIEALNDSSDSVRMYSADALGGIGDISAVSPLIKALKDNAAKVRSTTAYSLGELGETSAVEALIETLKDSSAEARRSAARALGNIGDKIAIPALTNTLNDDLDRDVKIEAEAAIYTINNR